MKTLYNEGRVVGLSSYELYIRQVLSRNPEAHILSESQWLAASLSTNNSMIIKIESGTTAGYHDYILPEGSDLCGCTCLLATIFEGSITTDENNNLWARRVDDYGRLIANTAVRHPVTPGEPANVPAKTDYRDVSQLYLDQCAEYMKISSGLMFQPGEWIDNIYQVELLDEAGTNIVTEEDEPILADMSDDVTRMSFNADLSKRGFIRILFNEDIEHDFYIFFHGLTYKNIMAGMSGFEELLKTDNPENGDFLGPQAFPWAVRVVFVYNNDMMVAFKKQQTQELEQFQLEIELFKGHINYVVDNLTSIVNTMDSRITTLEEVVPRNWEQLIDLINETNFKIGDLANLTTTHKENIVSAINEVNEADG